MAGYSGTPLAKKLGIKLGCRVLSRNAPPHFKALLEPWPEQAAYDVEPSGLYAIIVTFETNSETIIDRFNQLIPHLEDRGGLWFSWPKKASQLYVPGLTEDIIRNIGLTTGLVDNKVCAIDEDWSGLRFVRRLNK
jgi:hypothetical protein